MTPIEEKINQTLKNQDIIMYALFRKSTEIYEQNELLGRRKETQDLLEEKESEEEPCCEMPPRDGYDAQKNYEKINGVKCDKKFAEDKEVTRE